LVFEESSVVYAGGQDVAAIFEHRIDATLRAAGLYPFVMYKPLPMLSLSMGVRASWMLTSTYWQRETLLKPVDSGSFENGMRTRNEFVGEIPDASSIMTELVGSLAFALPLNNSQTLQLVPELSYSHGVTNLVNNRSWTANAIYAGLTLKYKLPPSKTDSIISPPPPQERFITATLRAVGVDADGHERPVVGLLVEEYLSTQTFPLLHYVFFEENTSSIPQRYTKLTHENTMGFDLEAMSNSGSIDLYHNILNIVGYRMRQNPLAVLSIEGCNSNTGAEAGKIMLSEKRAESVRDYLSTIWGIEKHRLTVTSRNLPENPTSNRTPEGRQENQRVELRSNNALILAPLIYNDTLRRVNPPGLRFYPLIQSSHTVESWDIVIWNDEGEFRNFSNISSVPDTVTWHIEAERARGLVGKTELHYALELSDGYIRAGTPPTTIPIVEKTIRMKILEQVKDKFIQKYDLILFDFGSKDLTDSNKRVVEFVIGNLDEGDTLSITGYTDSIGDSTINKNLSIQRARTVEREFLSTGVNTRASGVGASMPLYSNELPEGRCYNRTVRIIVEKQSRR